MTNPKVKGASRAAIDGLGFPDAGIKALWTNADDHPDSRLVFHDNMTLRLGDIDRLVPCFTPGTLIATPRGEVAVEALKAGDRILTRDNGIQTINWVAKKRLDHAQLSDLKALRPIQISAGALGPQMPDRDTLVSPAHRMLITSEVAQLHFGQSEVLVAAKDLCHLPGVSVSNAPYVTYIHFLCDNHEIVLADGAWSESFQPGDFSLKGVDQDQRDELFALFPELATKEGIKAYQAARPSLSKADARLVLKK